MQKTRRLHRLWAVLMAVFLAVCCLPTSAFAAQDKISSHVFVTLKLDGEEKGKVDFWLGELPYTPGSDKTRISWSELLKNEKMKLPENTQVKADIKGDCELPLKLSGAQEPPTFRSDLTVELEKLVQLDFTVRYVGSGGANLGSQQVSLQFGPSTAPEAWSYVTGLEKFQGYKATLKELKIEQDGDKTYTEGDHLKIGPDMQGKTLVAYLDKSSDTGSKTVNFSLRYLSTDNQIQDTQSATLSYTLNDAGTDLWNFVMDQAAYKTYEAQGYKMEDYVVPAEGGDRLCDKQGLQNVNADLEGKEIIVHLVKKTEAKAEQVPFRLRYLSTDGNISDEKNVEVPYDPNGKIYDLWSYIEDSRTYKGYQTAGYTMTEFVVPHQEGNRTYTGANQFAVTPSLRGITVTVTLDKPVVSTKKTVDFTLQYMSNDKILDVTKRVSAQYDPEEVLTDLWDYLKDTGTVKAAVKSGYTLQDYVLDEHTIQKAGVYAVNGDLAGKTVVVHLYKEPVATAKTVDFRLRYLSTDNQIQDTQPATLTYEPEGVLTDAWDFVLAQDACKTYMAQGYTLSDYVIPAEGGDRICEHRGMQAVTTDLQDKEIIVHLVKKTETKMEQVPFRLAFRSTDGNIADDKDVEVPYDANGKTYDLWSYVESTGAYKGYQKAGYTMKSFVVPQPAGDKTYTGAGQFTVTPALRGAIVTVTLDKPVVSTKKTVDFTVKYLSNDKVLDMTKQVSAQYDPEGVLTDLWDYLAGTGTVQSAKKDGYTLQDYELNGRTVKTGGVQAVNETLAGKTVTVHLYKEPVSASKTVNFQLRFVSTDNQIHETKAATLTYDPAGVLTDLWDFLLANTDYKNFAKDGYKLSDYVVTRENGDLNGVARGIQAVTTDLEGKTVIVHLVKEMAGQAGNVEFKIHFLSTDGKIDTTKAVSVPYDPNGKSYDAWNYLLGTGAFQSYSKDGYALKDLVVHQAAGDMTYTRAGTFTVTPALQGATVLVHLDNTKTPARYESVYTVHFVDEKGKEFQPAATVKVNWTEGQQLNLVAQLQNALKTVSAKGYTFRTLSAWNSSAAYKGTELVVPGNWELAAHCTKNAAPAAPQKPAQTAKAKPAAAPAKAVVKPAAPAANNTKILPKTGLQAQTPVVFGVMLFAALAGAAVYLFALRKKLN